MSTKKIFVSGSLKTDLTTKEKKIVDAIVKEIITNKKQVLIGDAPGFDIEMQNKLKHKNYDDVKVYTVNEKPRNIANQNWKIEKISTDEQEKNFYVEKDRAMANIADEGFLAINFFHQNESHKRISGGTMRNLVDMISQNKPVNVVFSGGLEHQAKIDNWWGLHNTLIEIEKKINKKMPLNWTINHNLSPLAANNLIKRKFDLLISQLPQVEKEKEHTKQLINWLRKYV